MYLQTPGYAVVATHAIVLLADETGDFVEAFRGLVPSEQLLTMLEGKYGLRCEQRSKLNRKPQASNLADHNPKPIF